MTENISPNINISESNFIVNTSINPTLNIALFVGEFEKGIINEPVMITSALQFKQTFGRATENNYNSWYQVYNYLLYLESPRIWVCRTAGSGSTAASKNNNIASSEGEWGNLLTVEIYNKNEYNNYLKDVFGFYNINDIEKTFLVIIRRKDSIVEFFNIDTSNELNSTYLNSINLEQGIYKLENGYTSSAIEKDYIETFSIFTKEDYEIDIVISPEDFNSVVINFVESRKDCVAFLNIPQKYIDFLIVNEKILETENERIIIINEYKLKRNIKDIDFNNIFNYLNELKRSSYCFMCFGFKMQIDKFTDKKRLISTTGDIAGLKAKNSYKNPWSIGAGIINGRLRDYNEVAINIKEEYKKLLYIEGVNVLENGVLNSQKLFVNNAFNITKLYHRNIFNYIERKAEKLLRKYIFRVNELSVRNSIMIEIKKLLEDMVDNRGIEAGKVYVTKDNEKIIINIYIKMINTTEIVKLGLINAGSTVDLTSTIQFKEI